MRLLVRLALLAYPRPMRARYEEEIAEYPASPAVALDVAAAGLAERFEGVWRDLRLAVRALARTPGPSLVAMLAIALGVGANVAVYSVVRPVLLEPLPFAEADRLYDLTAMTPGMAGRPNELRPIAFEPHYLDWRDQSSQFEAIEAWRSRSMTRYGDDRAEAVRATFITAGLPAMLGVKPLAGRGLTASDDVPGAPNVIVLSEHYWRSRYGAREDAVGETIALNEEAYEIIGVAPGELNRLSDADVWRPMRLNETKVREGGMMMTVRILGRLKPGVTDREARQELEAILQRNRETSYGRRLRDPTAQATPLAEHLVGPVKKMIQLVWGAVGLVLLIACANVAGILLVRSIARQGETGVRLALGAGRSSLLRQALGESLLLAVGGTAAGVLMAYSGVRVLTTALPKRFPRTDAIAVDGSVLAFGLVAAVAVGIAAGLVPAWSALGQNAWKTIRQRSATATAGRGAVGSLGALTAIQVGLAAVLLTGAGLLSHSLMRLSSADAGVYAPETAHLFANLPRSMPKDSKKAFFHQLLDRVRSHPGVRSASLSNGAPLMGFSMGSSFELPDDPPLPEDPAERRSLNFARMTMLKFAGDDYLETVGARLAEGRPLRKGDGQARGVLINQSLAQTAFPGGSALGKSIRLRTFEDKDFFTVVGVVADYRQVELRWPIQPEFIAHIDHPESSFHAISARPADATKNLLPILRETAVAINPAALPYMQMTQAEALRIQSGEDRFRAGLVSLFAVIALLLAGSGIFATVAFSVTRRLREIAIRRALGATGLSICRTALGRVLQACGLGAALGLTAAYWLRSLTEGFLYEVESLDPASFGFAFIALIVLAIAASWGPARRAVRLDPAQNLRAD